MDYVRIGLIDATDLVQAPLSPAGVLDDAVAEFLVKNSEAVDMAGVSAGLK